MKSTASGTAPKASPSQRKNTSQSKGRTQAALPTTTTNTNTRNGKQRSHHVTRKRAPAIAVSQPARTTGATGTTRKVSPTYLLYVGRRFRQALVDSLAEQLLVATRVRYDVVREIRVAAELQTKKIYRENKSAKSVVLVLHNRAVAGDSTDTGSDQKAPTCRTNTERAPSNTNDGASPPPGFVRRVPVLLLHHKIVPCPQ